MSDIIILKLKSEDGEEIIFKVKKSTKFNRIFSKYCEKHGINNKENIRFIYDGDRINENQTIQEVGIVDGGEIDVKIEQIGGGLNNN